MGSSTVKERGPAYFTTLNSNTNVFETVPEYPEFSWVEALVNAVAHREYAMEGAYA